ncbi:MAG: hypothetical protein AAB575_00895, partial [Patescibacteria group bacterium]
TNKSPNFFFIDLLVRINSVVYSLLYRINDCPDKLVQRDAPQGDFLTPKSHQKAPGLRIRVGTINVRGK